MKTSLALKSNMHNSTHDRVRTFIWLIHTSIFIKF